jgi:hypothetical protein
MGRTARVNFRGRRSVSQLTAELERKPITEWPPRLRNAWHTLTRELELAPAIALAIMQKAISAGQQCVKAQNKLLSKLEQDRARLKLQNALRRVCNGIKRAPAALRRRIDQRLIAIIQVSTIDLEVIESIFETAAREFESQDSEITAAAARALRGARTTPFSMLDIAARRSAEQALAHLAAKYPADPASAITIFCTLAQALQANESSGPSAQVRKLVTSYVAQLAEIWRGAGLRPGRAYHEASPGYSSKFHWFADDILSAASGSSGGRSSRPERVYDDDLRPAFRRELKFSMKKSH